MLWLSAAIFAVTYLGLALGKLPRLFVDRAGIAFIGAALMLAVGTLTLAQATSPESIDYETLLLLFGMMVVVGFLRISGAFTHLTNFALRRISSPRGLLFVTIMLSGLLSVFLVNDILCVALTPLVLLIARRLKFDPIPHLMGLATAANIGSVGTITGNPQNMIIGVQSRISYLSFAEHLLPVALIGLAIDFIVIAVIYQRTLRAPMAGESWDTAESRDGLLDEVSERRAYRRLQRKSTIVAALTIVLFFLGLPIALVALGAAAVLLLSRVKPARVYREIDWPLLLMFVGLFIVVRGFQLRVAAHWDIAHWDFLLLHPVTMLSVISAGLSNLVSNVPAVLLFKPVVRAMPPLLQSRAWLALAMSSTLAGNLTVLGAVANLIVVETAKREGVRISFWEFCRAGVPVTLLTLALGVAWLQWVPA